LSIFPLQPVTAKVFWLLGPNGAGKTTTMRVLNTLLPVQEGSVQVFGLDVRRRATDVRRHAGYVPQQISIEAARRCGATGQAGALADRVSHPSPR
jgi:ABC-2 type transport system ATP-binding protein